MNLRAVIFLSTLIICGFLFSSRLLAQTTDGQFINILSVPRSPQPGEMVKITVQSFTKDINYANIQWYVNGQFHSGGVGQQTLSLQLSGDNSRNVVEARIQFNDGTSDRKNITLTANHLDILWQPNTYTPPFYRGSPLFTSQSSITLVAVPSFGNYKLPGFGISYRWFVNGVIDTESSGYGKNSFTFTDSILSKKEYLKVEAISPDGSRTERVFSIKAAVPKTEIYLNNPLLGILYNNAISSELNMSVDEFSLRAEPYFFSNPSARFIWKINNQVAQNNTMDLLLLKGEGSGKSLIELSVKDFDKILQNAERSVSLIFKN